MGHLQGQGLYIRSDVVEIRVYHHCFPVCQRFCVPTLLHYQTRYLSDYHVTFSFFEVNLVYTMFIKVSSEVVSATGLHWKPIP